MRATMECCEEAQLRTERYTWRCQALPPGTATPPPEWHTAEYDDSSWARLITIPLWT